MTPVEIFLLGWQEYQKKREIVRLLGSCGEFDNARLSPPTEEEIRQILSDHNNEPVMSGPPDKGTPHWLNI